MFRFSIRELLLVTIIAATGLGWWVDRLRMNVEREQLRGKLERTQLELLHEKGRTWETNPFSPYDRP